MMPIRKESMFDNMVAVKGNEMSFIGKLVYFTIGRTLIKESVFFDILKRCDISEDYFNTSYTATHAFKSATKGLERKVKEYKNGNLEIYNINILDNVKEDGGTTIVREIKKEIVGERQNRMIYLGNFILHQDAVKRNLEKVKLAAAGQYSIHPDIFEEEIEYRINPSMYNEVNFDIKEECQKVIDFYYYAKDCINEDRIVTFVENYITNQLDASPINIHGKLFFVPIYKGEELSKLEQFVLEIEQENKANGLINFAAVPVVDSAQLVNEYKKEFYNMARNEIEIYQKRLQHFIEKEKVSEKIMNAWLDKINKFMVKKKNYEKTLRQNLDDMDTDIDILNRQIREVEIKMSMQSQGQESLKFNI